LDLHQGLAAALTAVLPVEDPDPGVVTADDILVPDQGRVDGDVGFQRDNIS